MAHIVIPTHPIIYPTNTNESNIQDRPKKTLIDSQADIKNFISSKYTQKTPSL